MFSSNPFAELSASISPTVMQSYVVVMILLVAAGTLFDVVHKKSAKYFFQAWKKSKSQGTDVGAGEMVSIGALMVCVGGYWFWFFIRVDVLAEGHSPFRIIRADLFILSLLISVTLGLVWSYLQASGNGAATILLGAYILANTVLFGSVPWSKFSHMFYKPAAALEKRVSAANGTRSNLPAPTNKPETFGKTLEIANRHADFCIYDPLRRLWTMRRHLPVRYHAYR
jgi:hypothetical protein